jgi:hypothetical protein
LRRNVEHSLDQPLRATFGIRPRSISAGTPTFVCVFRNNHFRLRADAAAWQRDNYRQGGTLGEEYKHWFRAKFLQQFSLFFRSQQTEGAKIMCLPG